MTVFGPEVPAPCRPFALLPPHFSVFLACETERIPMRRSLAIVALCLALTPENANAGERPADAALGAVSGALVFGPIGAVAGAVVGYTAGPSISHGLRRGGAPRQARRPNYEARAAIGDAQPAPRETAPASQSAPVAAAPIPAPAPAQPPAGTTASVAPPVQPLE